MSTDPYLLYIFDLSLNRHRARIFCRFMPTSGVSGLLRQTDQLAPVENSKTGVFPLVKHHILWTENQA